MATPTLILGANNWAIEEDNILGYALGSSSNQYLPREISFTRGSDATYTDSTGVIRQACWNLLQQSENFDSGLWGKQNITIATNSTYAPDSTLTAEQMFDDTSSNWHRILYTISLISGNPYTYSIYLKANTETVVQLNSYNIYASNSFNYANFDLQNGVIGTYANCTPSITSIGDGWYRCSITQTSVTTGTSYIYVTFSDNNPSSLDRPVYTGTSKSFYLWGAQLVQGSEPLAYLRTTDRLNIPRVDSSTGSKAFLLEPQRTNLLVYSNDFTNVSWTKTNIIPTPNVSISPENTTNAHRIFETVNSGNHGLAQQITLSLATNYTISCYVKKGNRSYCGLQFWYNVTNGVIAFYNLDNGTLVYEFAEGTGYSISNSKIEDVGDGWYRLSAVVQVGITLAYPGIVMASTEWSTGTSYDNSYLGDSSKYMDVYGFQLEAGSYPTTYIPTQASTVTRLADTAQTTGISSLIGQTEGTVFMEFSTANLENYTRRVFSLSDGTNSNQINLQLQASTTTLTFAVLNGAAAQALISTSTNFYTLGSTIKISVAYKANDFVFYANGTQIGVDTSGTVPTCSQFRFADPLNASQFIGGINQAALFPTRLSNAELATLTTL